MKPLHIAYWVGGLAIAGYILYRMFSSTTAAPLTVAPEGSTPAGTSTPTVTSSNGSPGRVGYRKSRRGSAEDWAPPASAFKTADVIKEADSVIEGDDDEMGDDSEIM
jgi:hypothetical protein